MWAYVVAVAAAVAAVLVIQYSKLNIELEGCYPLGVDEWIKSVLPTTLSCSITKTGFTQSWSFGTLGPCKPPWPPLHARRSLTGSYSAAGKNPQVPLCC